MTLMKLSQLPMVVILVKAKQRQNRLLNCIDQGVREDLQVSSKTMKSKCAEGFENKVKRSQALMVKHIWRT